jgi:hypothetical protein
MVAKRHDGGAFARSPHVQQCAHDRLMSQMEAVEDADRDAQRMARAFRPVRFALR